MQPLLDKSEFINLEDRTWLFCGAESPPLRGALAGMQEYMHARALGPGGRERNAEIENNCRSLLARLLHGQPEQITFVSSSSEAISNIALSCALTPGDNIVINTLEFPSGVLPSLAMKENGIEIRVVPHRAWEVHLEDIMAQVDGRTRLVITSHVSYLSGARFDYKSLYQRLQTTDALLLLDATQALGAVDVDMNGADFVITSCYKWLLGTHGAAVLAVNPKRTTSFRPRLIGWRGVTDMFSANRFESFQRHEDARQFDLGYPNYPTLYALNYAVNRLLEIGPEAIERHILALGGYLADELHRNGYALMTPREPARRAGNIAFVCANGEQVAQALREENIYVWGGDGRVRASVHLFNGADDIDRFLNALGRVAAVGA